MADIVITINQEQHKLEADPQMPLLWVLRDQLNLTGTKFGCGRGLCGACTVHVNGQATRSCQTTIGEVQGKRITTIEGLSQHNDHPLQLAWIAEQAPQCGYCQTGMIMTAAELLREKGQPTDADIDNALGGHICRCGTYQRIRKAIHRAAQPATAKEVLK